MRVLFALFALSASLTFHSMHNGDMLYAGDEVCKKYDDQSFLNEHKCIRLVQTQDKRCVLYYNDKIIVARPFTWQCVLRYNHIPYVTLSDSTPLYYITLWMTDADTLLNRIK